MAEGITINQLLEKFDHFKRTPNGKVIIHPGLPYNLIELKEEFVTKLKADLHNKLVMTTSGIDELDATTIFTIFMLEDSF